MRGHPVQHRRDRDERVVTGTMGASTVTRLATVPFDRLTGEQLDAWHRLRSANPALDSPYFHPGFAAAVHASGVP